MPSGSFLQFLVSRVFQCYQKPDLNRRKPYRRIIASCITLQDVFTSQLSYIWKGNIIDGFRIVLEQHAWTMISLKARSHGAIYLFATAIF